MWILSIDKIEQMFYNEFTSYVNKCQTMLNDIEKSCIMFIGFCLCKCVEEIVWELRCILVK